MASSPPPRALKRIFQASGSMVSEIDGLMMTAALPEILLDRLSSGLEPARFEPGRRARGRPESVVHPPPCSRKPRANACEGSMPRGHSEVEKLVCESRLLAGNGTRRAWGLPRSAALQRSGPISESSRSIPTLKIVPGPGVQARSSFPTGSGVMLLDRFELDELTLDGPRLWHLFASASRLARAGRARCGFLRMTTRQASAHPPPPPPPAIPVI